MRSLLYIIAVILIIGWAIGFFAYSAGWHYSHSFGNCNYCFAPRRYQKGLISYVIN